MVLDKDDAKLRLTARKIKTLNITLDNMKVFVAKYNLEVNNPNQVDIRLNELESMMQSFLSLQDELELLVENEDEDRVSERLLFQEKWFDVKAALKELGQHIENHSDTSGTSSKSTVDKGINNCPLRLPAIVAPTFDGNLQQWSSFIDSFNAMFHNNSGLAPVQKFHYLKSSLTGSASDVVKTIPITDNNYNQAYQKLVERYENPGLIIQSHIRALFDTPKVQEASASQLHKLHHHVITHVRALESLNQPIDSWDAWLVTLLCCRLDSVTVSSEWQLKQTTKMLPKFKDFESFLSSRVIAYEAGDIACSSSDKTLKGRHPGRGGERRTLLSNVPNSPVQCRVCNGNHKIFVCDKFKQLSVHERKKIVNKHNLCFKCLYPGLSVRSCKSSWNCSKCNRWHNTLLHDNVSNDKTGERVDQGSSDELKEGDAQLQGSTSITAMYVNAMNSHVVLSTAVVHITSACGKRLPCRAVLDCGSQVSFVTKECAKKLCVTVHKSDMHIAGIGQTSTSSMSMTSVNLHSRVGEFNTKIDLFVLSVITNNLPSCQLNTTTLKIPGHVKKSLADPQFDEPGPIDLLLGADVFFEVLKGERIVISDQAYAQSTALGWIIIGKLQTCISHSGASTLLQTTLSMNHNSALSLFSSIKARKHQEQLEAEEQFTATVQRNSEGRFIVRLPLSKDRQELGNSLNMARTRFFNLERRLLKNQTLAKSYNDFILEYLSMGHMEEIEGPGEECCYYLPHHAVIKQNSLTTKTRVVFDASAITTSGLSLNDILLCGPTVQCDLYSILLSFRTHAIVLTADVEKMYRQVLVAPDDQDLQRILFRSNPQEPLAHYRLRTVTYGTKSAPYLATRCLLHISDSVNDKTTKRAIKQDFYVDDFISGADSVDEGLQLYAKVSAALQGAGMPLRKWCSNSNTLLSQIPHSQSDPTFVLRLNEEETISTLGLSWQPSVDQFRFLINPYTPPMHMTKRTLLSDINRVYDPLGFLTPVLITGKIFVQQLWALKLGWDTLLPMDFQRRWKSFYHGLECLQGLRVPRACFKGSTKSIQLHGFSDASQQAFGACVYLKSTNEHDECQSILLSSRSRVSPMRQMTIPRLELCGAMLLAGLIAEIISEFEKMNIKIARSDIILWTDSMIVLAWINCASPLKTYVANRVAQILDVTEARQWRHVPTRDNPADMITRGVDPDTFLTSYWWTGPMWLTLNVSEWPSTPQQVQEIPETRVIKLVLITTESSVDLLNRYSEWMPLIRITAWMLRFVSNARSGTTKAHRRYGPLTVLELTKARNSWLCIVQDIAFREDIIKLKANRNVVPKSPLKSLNPFIDNDGLLRVGGRLLQSSVPYSQKCSILLPAKSKLTRLLFEYEHRRLLHAGPQALLAYLHTEYWPLRGRNLARDVVHKCIVCYRSKPTLLTPLMAPLPRQRVTIERPFARTGVDFCGPIMIKSGIRRVVAIKSYISVFVCLVTRAVHLELVSGLTTEAFMAALSRFMSRRGHCKDLYSDNGTNFVGASKVLTQYFSQAKGNRTIDDMLTDQGVQWHFIPPAAPHFGGIWEAAVKSAKTHLLKTTKGSLLNFEDMQTLLCRIEAILNSRPMTPISSSPSDYEPLTPAHFLVGGPLTAPPEPDLADVPVNRLRRLELIRAQTQLFWRRWSKEYIPQLQRRNRWSTLSRDIKVGDLAILKEDGLPPLKWKLVRVIQTHPGSDGIVRVVTAKTSSFHHCSEV